MNLIFITEARYIRLADENVYSLESSFSYSLYQRYMKFFDSVTIVARVKQGTEADVNPCNCVTKGNVEVYDLPYYVGFNGYLKKRGEIKSVIEKVISKIAIKETAIVCRIPGRICANAIEILDKKKIPYGVEVVGDPYDVLSKGSVKHPLRPVIRILSLFSLKRLCKKAPAALYVTKETLQKRYPCNNFNVGVSDVVMPAEAFVKEAKTITNTTIKLICVGTLEQGYKAPDVVTKALKIMHDKGLDFNFTWVGDGILKAQTIKECEEYGIAYRCHFLGKLSSGNAVREQLDKADIYMMPSRMEGLPRALVEAMARALPCVATRVGGIPEMIDPEAIIEANNPEALAERVIYLVNNPTEAYKHSKINLQKAKEYSEDNLSPIRESFYEYVKKLNKNA